MARKNDEMALALSQAFNRQIVTRPGPAQTKEEKRIQKATQEDNHRIQRIIDTHEQVMAGQQRIYEHTFDTYVETRTHMEETYQGIGYQSVREDAQVFGRLLNRQASADLGATGQTAAHLLGDILEQALLLPPEEEPRKRRLGIF